MDWDKLRIFHVVAGAGSFTHAGETLGLSQSAISRQISALEESLGVPLFHRHARGLLLTEQGELLQKEAREIFGRLAMIEGQLMDTSKKPEGPLRVTVANFIGTTWLAPKLSDFLMHYPDIQLTILQDDRIFDLAMREADAAIRLYKPENPELASHRLTTINFHICASKSYLKKHGAPDKVKDLKDHMLIVYPENSVAPFDDPNWLLRIADVNAENHPKLLRINSLYAIHNCVQKGIGIAVLPDYLIRANKDIEIILPKTQRPGVDMFFVHPRESAGSKRIAVFRDFLLNQVRSTDF